MEKCPHCGAQLKDKYKVCSICGTILATLSTEVTAHINLLRKKIESEPKNVNLHNELAGLLQKHNFLYEALDEYQKVIVIDPKNFDAHHKSGIIHLKLNDLVKAEISFRSALHIKPDSEDALIGLFRVYYLQNKTIEAIALGEKILKIKPDSVEFHMLIKNLYRQKGDKEKAFMELQKLETLVPNNEEVIREIVQYFTDQNDMEGLTKYYQKMEEMRIEDIQLGFMIGKYYYETGEYDKAIEMLKGLLLKENISEQMSGVIHTYLVFAYFDKGDVSGAENLILKISPATQLDTEMRKKLALIFSKNAEDKLKDKRPRQAIPFFEKAIEFDPDAKQYQENLEKTNAEIANANKKFIRKTLSILFSTIGVCIFVILMWIFLRNRIIIYVEPATDLTILIDGRQTGLKSKGTGVFESAELFIGSHTVDIEKQGYEKFQKKVNIGFAVDVVVRVNLVPVFGAFRVNSEPESANVYLDGQVIGKTPYVSGNIPVAPHKIDIEFPGYQIYTNNINIAKGETLDLGTIPLKDILGTWVGKIGEDGVAYNASFKMTISQKKGQLKVKYSHQPTRELSYNGEINAIVVKNDFLADGYVNCRERNVFYWVTTKKRVVIRGKLSGDWERIEGKHFAEGLGEHNWWAGRKK